MNLKDLGRKILKSLFCMSLRQRKPQKSEASEETTNIAASNLETNLIKNKHRKNPQDWEFFKEELMVAQLLITLLLVLVLGVIRKICGPIMLEYIER